MIRNIQKSDNRIKQKTGKINRQYGRGKLKGKTDHRYNRQVRNIPGGLSFNERVRCVKDEWPLY